MMKCSYIVHALVVSFVAVFSFASGNLSLASDAPILLGCVGDFSGTYSTIGRDQKAGIEMAIDEINATGGVLNRKLKAVFEDCGAKPSLAATKTEKLILHDKADCIIGSISSGSTLAMMKIAEKYKVLMLAPISESTKITGEEKSKYVFRFPAHVFMTNFALAKWMIENAGRRIYLLSVDYAWGRDSSAVYREGVKKFGGQIVGETYFPLKTKDFAPYFGKIKSAHPDALLITSAGNDAISVLTQLNQYGLSKTMKFGGAGSMIAESNLQALGDSAEGFVTVDYYAASLDNPANKKFRENYAQRFGREPSKFGVMSYETVKWLAKVIRETGSMDVEKLITCFEGSDFAGPQGFKKIDKGSHQALLPVYLLTINNGKKVLVAQVSY